MKKQLYLIALSAVVISGAAWSSGHKIDAHYSAADAQLIAQSSVNSATNMDTDTTFASPDTMTYCLLPAKVRNLRRGKVHITPRKVVKTTRVECDINGGQIVEEATSTS